MIQIIWDFIRVFFRFGREVLIQEYHIRKTLKPFLRQFPEKGDSTYTEKDIKRMCYYARFVPAVSGAAYGILVNRTLTTDERRLMLLLSAAAPVFDDYFDDKSMMTSRLKIMIENPHACTPENTKEKVFLNLLCKISSGVRDMDYFMEICMKVYQSQIDALKQEAPETTAEELRKITMDKGGYSTLLFITLMEHPPIKGDRDAVYFFGGMVQWVDDIFDVYDDTKDGIRTPASTATDMNQLKTEFQNGLIELRRLFMDLDLPLKQKQRFLDLQWFFFTRAFVCLEQFIALQNQYATPFEPGRYSRKALICDMEKASNLVKWLKYFYNWKETLKSYD
jgi:hypothetical protein